MELKLCNSEQVALIDDEFSHLASLRWYVTTDGYAVTVWGYREPYLYEPLVNYIPIPEALGTVTGYRNGNLLDCRRANLILGGVRQSVDQTALANARTFDDLLKLAKCSVCNSPQRSLEPAAPS